MTTYKSEQTIDAQKKEFFAIFQRLSPEQREDLLKLARLADIIAERRNQQQTA